MRIARRLVLPAKSIYHYMWRAINGKMVLKTKAMKRRFLESFFKFMKRARNKVPLHGFCVMSNHFHKAASLLEDSTHMSNWARSANSSFGQKYNRIQKRRGPVAQDRPKTIVVESQEALMRLMFYIDWNPVKAGMVTHPSEYEFSSYRYYAFGEVNEWTKHITPPQWYLDLGDTPEERQRIYRILCDEYNEKDKLPSEEEVELGHAYGSTDFVDYRNRLMALVSRQQRRGKIPRKLLNRLALGLLQPEELEDTRATA